MAVAQLLAKEMEPKSSDFKQFELSDASQQRQEGGLDLKSGITGVTAPDGYAPRLVKTECTMQRKIPSGKWATVVHFGASLPK
jgi:hypothetical protein